jgi:hypothetical protein
MPQRHPCSRAFRQQPVVNPAARIAGRLFKIAAVITDGFVENCQFDPEIGGQGSHPLFVAVRFLAPQMMVNMHCRKSKIQRAGEPPEDMEKNHGIGAARYCGGNTRPARSHLVV